jgi:hypothetical protein
MNKFDIYITFIFLVKIGFIITAITHVYLNFKGKSKSDLDNKILYWKERFEFIFIILMSILLIYLFNPRHDRSILIDHETKLLLYLFGFVLLITADWNTFVKESPWFTILQKIVGSEGKKL